VLDEEVIQEEEEDESESDREDLQGLGIV